MALPLRNDPSAPSAAARRAILTLGLALALASGAAPARAQKLPGLAKPAPTPAPAASVPAPAPAATPEPEQESPDSPRASARSFVELTTKKGDYKAAARYLQLPPAEEARGPELARRMRAVLERRFDIDLDKVSPLPEGATQDGLPAGVDIVGSIMDDRGGHEPVYIVRSRDAAGTYWAFSKQTVSRIDGWYDELPDRWVRDWVPQSLQRYGPGGLMWWQWLALPVLLVLALVLGRVLGVFSTAVLRRLFLRTRTTWDERLLARVSPALTLLWAAAAAALLLPWLALLPEAHRSARSVLGGLVTVAVFWAIWRSVDVWMQFLMERPWAVGNSSARSVISITRNLGKALIAVGGVVAALGALGYPVATVLAGLGIGGIALAFGAQKTIENLFGSIALAADQPFRVGDFVKIEDFTGNVERIGMRSTQVRTIDRTLITVPNGKLSEMRIEDFARRDRIRFATTVGLPYGTSEKEVRQVVEGIEKLLRGNPRVWPDVVVSRLAAFSPSSLDVEVLCWFATTDFDDFRRLRQDALLGILRVVEEAGTSLAFPTRTVHVTGIEPRPAPERAAPRGQPIE